MKGKIVEIAIVVLVLFGLFITPQKSFAEFPKKMKIRLGVGSALGYNPHYVAKEKGFNEEEGLDVEFVWTQASPEAIQAIIGGSADAGSGGSFGVIAGVSKGAPVITVTTYGYGGERIALAVRKDVSIKTLRDLYGKKVGFQPGTVAHQMFYTMCVVEGLDMSKIDVIYLNNIDMPSAIASKSVDAIITWEVLPSLLEAKGLVNIIQRGGKYQKSLGCVFFDNSFAKKNRDAVLRFVKANFKAHQFIRQNPREASIINSKYIKGEGALPEVLEKSYSYMVFDPRINQDTFEMLDADIKFMLSQKKIETAVKPTQIASREFSDEIVKKYPELVKDLK